MSRKDDQLAYGVGVVTGMVAIVVFAIVLTAHACNRPHVGQVVSAGAGAAELICAVLLDEQGVEHEICETGTKLAELLGNLLAAGAGERATTAPAASVLSSAVPLSSAARAAPSSSAAPAPPRVRLIRLYAKPGRLDAGAADAAIGSSGQGAR